MRCAADIVIRFLYNTAIRIGAGSLTFGMLKLAMGGLPSMLMALVTIVDPLFSGETQVAPAPFTAPSSAISSGCSYWLAQTMRCIQPISASSKL